MTPERIETIYDELGRLIVELAPDPSALGPNYLQDLISKTRGYLNKTSLFLHEIHREGHHLERELAALEAAYELSADELLASDSRVSPLRLPNIDDRKAMVNMLLREERVKIQDLKRRIRELNFVEKAVKHRHKELDNTVSSIRMQKSLIDSELRTGSFYGDETNTSRRSTHKLGVSDEIDEAELAKLMGEIPTPAPQAQELESPDPQDVGDPPEDKPKEGGAEEAAMRRFLEGDDYSDIFDTLS